MARKNTKKNIIGNDSERTAKIRTSTNNRHITRIIDLFLICVIFLFYSCNSDLNTENNNETTAETYLLNEEVCTQFAKNIHQSFVQSDTLFIDRYIDWSQVQSKIVAQQGHELTVQESAILARLKNDFSIGSQLAKSFTTSSHLRFISYYQEDSLHYIILRVFEEPQTIDFIEMQLMSSNNTIAISDIYNYNESQSLVGWLTIRMVYYNQFEDWETIYTNLQQKENSIQERIQKGELAEAYKELKFMDAQYKTAPRYTELQDLILLASSNETLHSKYLENKLKRISISNRGRWLTLFYYNFDKEQYNDALLALVNLEQEVGADNMITFLKGNLHLELGNYEKALTFVNMALSSENEIDILHLTKVLIYLEMNDFEKATESLLVMKQYINIDHIEWTTELRNYPDYLASDAYAKWLLRIAA